MKRFCIAIFVFFGLFQGIISQPACYETRWNDVTLYTFTRVENRHNYRYSCGFLGLGRCRGTRVSYHSRLKSFNQRVSHRVRVCCPNTHTGTYPHCIPICNPACSNGGQCVYRQGGNYCNCPSGYRGSGCEIDINECEEGSYSCHRLARCRNTHGSYACDCHEGYRLSYDGYTCIDRNECSDGSHQCGAPENCENTDGSYICHCRRGYKTPEANSRTCVDINECDLANGGCQQICINEPGFFRCSCHRGYEENIRDLYKCDDIDECATEIHNCTHVCQNNLGSFACGCELGCALSSDKATCEDVNECLNSTSHGCNQICNNLHCRNGRYSCSCRPGYYLLSNNQTCADIDECSDSVSGCQHMCNNTVGSFYCTCLEGYQLASDQVSCEPLPCPMLIAPVNGYMECSHSLLAVGSTCNFTCKRDFELSGSAERTCLSSTSWSGLPAYCQIKTCPQLQPSASSLLVQSCLTSVNSSCILSCDIGYYHDNGVLFEQTCDVVDGIAEWSQPVTCRERTACSPNPCGSGTCYILPDSNTASCVCPSGLLGEQCQTLHVTVSEIPLLELNKDSIPITVTASTQSTVFIKVTTDPPITTKPSEDLTVSYPDNSTTFSLHADSSPNDIIRIMFQITAEGEEVSQIEDKLTVASSEESRGNYFMGNNRNILEPGCCSHLPGLAERFCSSFTNNQLITLSSSCVWTDTSSQLIRSNGIIFVETGVYKLPLSIVGIDMRVSDDGIATDFTSEGDSCTPCSPNDESGDCRMMLQSVVDVRDMVRRLAVERTFLRSIRPVLSSSLTLSIPEDFAKQIYNPRGYFIKLLVSSDITQQEECSNELMDTTTADLYYVTTVSADILFSYKGETELYSWHTSYSSTCFMYSLCGNKRTLYASIPSQLSEQIMNLTVFKDLSNENWQTEINTIATSRFGLPAETDEQIVNYWDGTLFTNINEPNYDLMVHMNIRGAFREQYLQVPFSFTGTLAEGRDGCPILRKAKGKLAVDIITGLREDTSTLHLEIEEGTGLYLMEGSCESSFNHGFNIDLFYSSLLSNGIYRKFFTVKGTNPCLVKSQFQFQNISHLEKVSLLSSCLYLRINKLELSVFSSMKITIFPKNEPVIPGSITTVFMESQVQSRTTIGNFFTISPMPGASSFQGTLLTDVNSVFGIMPFVNVSLFDTEIMTNMFINEQGTNFDSTIDLFDVGSSRITGRSDTERPWDSLQLSINVNLNNDFNEGLSAYLNLHIKNEANETIERLASVEKTAASASARVLEIKEKISRSQGELTTVQNSLRRKGIRLNILEERITIHEEELHNALETYWNDTAELQMTIESVCQIEACEKVCKREIIGTPCFTPIRFKKYIPCSKYEVQYNKVYKKKPEKVQITVCSGKRHLQFQPLIDSVRISVEVFKRNPIKGAATAPFRIVGGFLGSIFGRRKKKPCYPYEFYELKWQSMLESSLRLIAAQCPVTSVKDYRKDNCSYSAPCALLVDDLVCGAMNDACYANRTKLIKEFNEDNVMLLANIDLRYYHYDNSLRELTDISSEISILKLRNSSLKREIAATDIILQNAIKSEEIASRNLLTVKANEDRLLKLNDAIKDIPSVIRITDVYFDVTVETQTPVILPLRIVYELQNLGTSHEVLPVVDIAASKELIRKTILDNIIEDIIDNIIGTPSRKRRNVNAVSLSDIFSQQCNLQTNVIHYVNEIRQALFLLYNDTVEDITSITAAKDEEDSNYQVTVDALSFLGTNLSVSFLENEENFRISQIDAFDTVLLEINDSKIAQWRADMDEIHNDTGFIFADQTCYSLSDCLFISLSSIRKLISPIESLNTSEIYSELSDVHELLQELNDNSSWSFPVMLNAVIGVHQLAQKVVNLGYWCATPPIITEQPPEEVEVEVGNSLSLSCPVSSSISYTHSWTRNNDSIPFATKSLLYLPNVTINNSGIYQCTVRNAVGVTKSDPTLVSVYKRVTFTEEPSSTVVIQGSKNVYFICEVDTYPFPNFQWMYKPFGANSMWENITKNGTDSVLFIEDVSYANEGYYRCQVENEYNSITSRTASLTVLPGTFAKLSYDFEVKINSSTQSFGSLSFVNTLKSLFDTIPIYINVTSVTPMTGMMVKVSFSLAVSNYSSYQELSLLDYWYNQTVTDVAILQAVKSFMETTLRNQSHPFTFNDNGIVYQVNGSSVTIGPLLFNCPAGYEFNLFDFVCVGCQEGNYQNNSYILDSITTQPGVHQDIKYPLCYVCPKGTYQPNKASAECESCPVNYLTSTNGSTSHEDCKALCVPGTVSNTGFQPCNACNVSHYQLQYGQKSCLPCVNGTNISTCVADYCRPGYYSSTGFKPCTKCLRGYYQLWRAQNTCHKCNYNGTIAACVKDQCPPGYHSVDGLKPCLVCPRGSYQLQYEQRHCHICSYSSIHIDSCRSSLCTEDHYSSSGFEPCFLCEKGFYQPLRGQTNCRRCTPYATSLQCKSDVPPCHLPPYRGPCNSQIKRYFFNKTSGACESFIYGGCYRNKNNFRYQYECERQCGTCPPTCTYNYCTLHRFSICSMSPIATNSTDCPGGCRLSNCRASYFAPTELPMPNRAYSCAIENQCTVRSDGAEVTSMDTTCMRRWGQCVKRAYYSSRIPISYKQTPDSFHCWEYTCGGG